MTHLIFLLRQALAHRIILALPQVHTGESQCILLFKYSFLFISSIGAVAELFDASCFFNAIQSVYDNKSLSVKETQTSMRDALGYNPLLLGDHYFVNNPTPGGNGLSPTFDFRADSEREDPNAFVIASRIGDIPSPDDPAHDVDWLELKALEGQGDLAKYAFRILTTGGQPPSSVSNSVRWYFRRYGT